MVQLLPLYMYTYVVQKRRRCSASNGNRSGEKQIQYIQIFSVGRDTNNWNKLNTQ